MYGLNFISSLMLLKIAYNICIDAIKISSLIFYIIINQQTLIIHSPLLIASMQFIKNNHPSQIINNQNSIGSN